jgi:hypothetical protein
MSHFLFMDIPFALSGSPSSVHDAVAEMFQLAAQCDKGTPIPLHTYCAGPGEPLAMLPGWLQQRIAGLSASDEAIMLHGPEGDRASVAVQAQGLSCAWLSPLADEVRFVARKANNRKVGLSVAGSLVSVLREILCRQGIPLLHAAALRCPDGTGVLLQAEGGGGKSTTALSLIRQGARLLGDDLVALVGEARGRLQMTGFAEPMNLTQQTMDFFPELAALKAPAAGPVLKARVNPAEVYPEGFWTGPTALDVCFFVQIHPEGPAVEPLAPATALGRFLQSHTFSRGQTLAPAAAQRLLDLAERVPAYLLRTGSDPAALGVWLALNSARLALRDRPQSTKRVE